MVVACTSIHGLQKVTIEDVGFAVRMNVYRNNAQNSEVVKSGKAVEKHAGEGVSEGVNNSGCALPDGVLPTLRVAYPYV